MDIVHRKMVVVNQEFRNCDKESCSCVKDRLKYSLYYILYNTNIKVLKKIRKLKLDDKDLIDTTKSLPEGYEWDQ